MPQASLRWDGNVGPYKGLQVGNSTTVSNANVGGETSYNFVLFSKPSNSSAVLNDTANAWEKTLTPDVPGTYHVRLVVNNSLIDVSSAAALHTEVAESDAEVRMPGVGETTEFNASKGWAGAFVAIFKRLAHGFGVRPSAGQTYRGHTWLERGGAGTADTFSVCVKDDVDAYAWTTLIAAETGGTTKGHLLSDVTAQIDGLTDTFVVPTFETGKLLFERNGVGIRFSTVTEIGNTMVQLPVVPQIGEYLQIWYVPA